MSESEPLFARFGKLYAPNEVIFREGELGQTMYVLQSGKVRISKGQTGALRTLAMLNPGEFFGEMAILNHKPRSATAEAIEPSRVLVIDQRTFEGMVKGNSEIALRLIHKLARRLDSADALIEILMHRDPKARVILGLAREADIFGQDRGDGSVAIRTERRSLAAQVGVELSEVNDVLGRLARLGIVREEQDAVVITDLMRLQEFLDFVEKHGQREAR